MYAPGATLLWDEAISRTTGGITDLFVPLQGVEDVYSQVRLRELNEVSYQFGKTRSKLLIRQRSEKMVAYVLTYMPDGRYAVNHEAVLDTLGLGYQYTDYTGMLMVSSLDGVISHSFLLEDGEIRYKIVPRPQHTCEEGEACTHDDAEESPNYHIALDFYTLSVATTRGGPNPPPSFENDDTHCSFCWQLIEECSCLDIVGNVCDNCGLNRYYGCTCDDCPYCGENPCVCPNWNWNPYTYCWVCESDPCVCFDDVSSDNDDFSVVPPQEPPSPPPCNDLANNKANPLSHMELQPSSSWNNIRGATFGDTRTKKVNGERVPKRHNGIDLAGEESTLVYNMFEGVVTEIVDEQVNRIGDEYPSWYTGDDSDKGNRIAIASPLNGTTVTAHYWHLQEYSPIAIKNMNGEKWQVGDTIPAGAVIGYIGITGNASPERPHLHLGVFANGDWVNPTTYLNATVTPTSTQISTPCD
jgi:hypothetical protein